MRIRKKNIRSQKAAEKLPYTVKANETRKTIYQQLKHMELYMIYMKFQKIVYTCNNARYNIPRSTPIKRSVI